MPYFFIINPKAGKGRVSRLPGLIHEMFRGRKLRYEIAFTERKGHGLELSRRALVDGFTAIVAAGGDGTIREAAEPLVTGTAALGIIPCGSGNGLARNLGIPLSTSKALAGLLEWPARRIDVGLADGKPFFCAAGVGLDAEVARAFNSRGGGRRGILPYVYHALLTLLRYSPSAVTVSGGGVRREFSPLIAAVFNGRQYGGGARVAPDADIADGLLNLVVVRKAGVFRILRAVPDLFTGGLMRHTDIVTSAAGEIFEICFAPGAPYHLDGEDFTGGGTLRVSVLHRALNVLAPK
ncbi:MAG TPA: diacylglycerol kinase family lipid kinase [Elusimicrobiales bacterium]|nr:diacylglycerol kinase family lipid kinase [Elusimicrobiales bacterium]